MSENFAFEPVLVPEQKSVNRGGTIRLAIFIAGTGDPPNNKLTVSYPTSLLLDDDEPGYIRTSVKTKYIDGSPQDPVAGEEYIEEIEIDAIGTIINLSEGNFMPDPRVETGELEPASGHQSIAPQVVPTVGEQVWDGSAPIEVELNVAKDADPGHYEFPVTLTYEQNGIVELARDRTSIRVNNRRQQYDKLLFITGVLAGVTALISLLIQTLSATGQL